MLATFVMLSVGCTSPEEAASKTAVSYLRGSYADQHSLACAADRAATSPAELEADAREFSESTGISLSSEPTTDTIVAKTTTVAVDGTSAQVVLTRTSADDASKRHEVTLQLLHEEGDWCVDNRWAEQQAQEQLEAQYKSKASAADSKVTEALPLIKAFKYDEARANLDAAKAMLSEIPADHYTAIVARSNLEMTDSTLTSLSKDWLGGRWRGSTDKDPMTDQTTAVATLTALDGLPSSIGRAENAMLVLRCSKGKLDAYINAGTTLQSNYRYDTISGQYRIGDDPAQSLVGGVSTSRDSVFLRNPGKWLTTLKERDGDRLLVELPPYNRTPATVTFDLTASAKAVELVKSACP